MSEEERPQASDIQLFIALPPPDLALAEENGDRILNAMIVPWNTPTGDARRLQFAEGSITFDEANLSRVKLLDSHDRYTLASLIGVMTSAKSSGRGIDATFKMAKGTIAADQAWTLYRQGILDGVSVGIGLSAEAVIEFDEDSKSFIVRKGAILKETSLVSIPAFGDARAKYSDSLERSFAEFAETKQVASATEASTTGENVPKENELNENPTSPAEFDFSAMGDALAEAVKTGNADLAKQFSELLVANAANPQGAAAATGAATSSATATPREPYSFGADPSGHSWLRDMANAEYNDDDGARQRLRDFSGLLREQKSHAFDPNQVFATQVRSDLTAINPTIPRQDLYQAQLAYDRPLFDAVTTGTIADATPWTLPKWVSSSSLSQDHTEGTNSTEGSITLTNQTITPTTVDGLYKGSRELFEQSNPAVDAIVRRAMLLAYQEKIETRIYTMLNAVNSNVVPVAGSAGGDELGTALEGLYIDQMFVRGGYRVDRAIASKTAYKALSGATDDMGRPLYPNYGVMNADGTKVGVRALNVHGEMVVPAYSVPSADATHGPVFVFASESVFCWVSPLRMWKFEERGGPSTIELAVFGYEAHAVLRDADVNELNLTIT